MVILNSLGPFRMKSLVFISPQFSLLYSILINYLSPQTWALGCSGLKFHSQRDLQTSRLLDRAQKQQITEIKIVDVSWSWNLLRISSPQISLCSKNINNYPNQNSCQLYLLWKTLKEGMSSHLEFLLSLFPWDSFLRILSTCKQPSLCLWPDTTSHVGHPFSLGF